MCFFRRLTGLLVTLICFILVVGCAPDHSRKELPRVEKGMLDLTDWDFDKDGSITLDGEWAFYWNQFLESADMPGRVQQTDTDLIQVPGNWNEHTINGKPVGGYGYATYRLLIRVSPEADCLALKMLEAAHAYTLWVNSKEVVRVGTVGKDRDSMKAAYRSKLVIVRPENGTIELLFHVSNFMYERGGLWNAIEFGTVDQMNQEREENLVIEFLLFGSILIMGLYHFGLFLLRREDRSTLYFSLFCLLIALRIVLVGERMMHAYLPWIGWDMLMRLEYLTFYLGAPMFLMFLSNLYPEHTRKLILAVVGVCLVFSAIVMVTDPGIYSQTLHTFQTMILLSGFFILALLVRALFNRREGIVLVVFGSAFLLCTLFYDVLVTNGIIHSIEISPLGLFVFILVQSVMLSIRFSKAFKMVAELSTKLEHKVDMRTKWLQDANIAIRQSNRQLRETQSQLIQSQKMEAMGTLAGGIAHDFNNILGSILGYSEMMLNGTTLKDPEREYVNAISRSGERAADLVRRILTFSRGDYQELSPMLIQTPLTEIIKMIRATLRVTVEIREHIDPACREIFANETQISQIVVNLCTNADYALKEVGGVIDISLKEVNLNRSDYAEVAGDGVDYLRLSVQDDGIGIPEGIRLQVFDPFFTTKGVSEGSGLGLSIVHGIIKNHQGFIRVESELGKGARFDAFFPITSEKQASKAEVKNTLKHGKGNILVVEDDLDLAAFYRATLDQMGYSTTMAHEGQEALDLFKAEPDRFDLVFSDQVMPTLTGLELSGHIHEIRPDIPIILATGYSETLTKPEMKRQGISYFLTKPVQLADLNLKIRELIG